MKIKFSFTKSEPDKNSSYTNPPMYTTRYRGEFELDSKDPTLQKIIEKLLSEAEKGAQ